MNEIATTSTKTIRRTSTVIGDSKQKRVMFKKFNSATDVSTSTPVKSSIQRAIKVQIQQQHPHITSELLDVLIPKKSSLIQYKVTSHLMLYCQRIEHSSTTTANSMDDDGTDPQRVPSDIPILFQHRDGPIVPTLKWILPYTNPLRTTTTSATSNTSNTGDTGDDVNNNTNNVDTTVLSTSPSHIPFTYVQVDRGAIPYLLGGAHIMCPGLTKQHSSYMPPDTQCNNNTNDEDNDNNGTTTTTTTKRIPGLVKGQGVIIYAEHQIYPLAIGVMMMDSMEMYVRFVIFLRLPPCLL
jgi:malignant T-cell-amplified sequence